MYEAQQAPLYYWLSAQVPKLFLDWALADRVLLLRFLTLMVASLVVPLTYLVGYAAGGIRLALTNSILLVAMPQFTMTASRVANDSFAAVDVALVVWQTF